MPPAPSVLIGPNFHFQEAHDACVLVGSSFYEVVNVTARTAGKREAEKMRGSKAFEFEF